MKLLEVKDFVIRYITEDSVIEAVNGVSFDIEEGETMGLVGETGAGKTTTCLGIMSLLSSTTGEIASGEILFRGEDLLKKPEREMRRIRGASISMIFQDPMTALNPVMTVGRQISEAIRMHQKCSKKEARIRMMLILEKVGILAERADDYPHQFSGGMKQRIVTAMALACNPALLIADEPTSALDVTIQAQVLEMIKDLQREFKTSMLLITHDLGIVAETCSTVGIMYAGEIVEFGSVEEIFAKPSHPYTVGLFKAIPRLDVNTKRLHAIPGLMPDPADLPRGCKFGPRCPYATEKCLKEEPTPEYLSDDHYVRCFHALESRG
jgi:peptide/nickel transport system ATP-binding protein